MPARGPSWWRQIEQRLVTILVVASILIVASALIIIGYRFDWTGFNGKDKLGKTLYDWMQLLFIPVVLAVAGFWFNHRERKAAELRADRARRRRQRELGRHLAHCLRARRQGLPAGAGTERTAQLRRGERRWG